MKNQFKHITLYIVLMLIISLSIYTIYDFKNTTIALQKNILIKEARTHFNNQVQNRKWNADYGGVYVKPINGLEANPYLADGTLRVNEDLTLIRINPAWMSRQLSQLSQKSTNDSFHFRITSLKPLNPKNKASQFETRALKYLEKNTANEYYELSNDKFLYMGALITEQSCLQCHTQKNYKLGNTRGGISISLDANEFHNISKLAQKNANILATATFILFSLIGLLIYKQIRSKEILENEVISQTTEILKTKELLQKVLDTDHSFLMVSKNKKIILANQTMLSFFSCLSLEEFIVKHSLISNSFETNKHEELLSADADAEYWIDYLQREQHSREIRVMMKKDGENRYFKAHSKELSIEGEKLYIIVFDEITKELEHIEILKDEASKDALTQLFNRGKFDDVLSKEISLSKTTKSPLNIIFLDIDFFKDVNDTHGHDVGDYILVEIAKLLLSSIRTGDFVARWGGEEFVVTLQSTNVNQAKALAEKIRLNIHAFDFKDGGKQSVSLGVTQYILGESQESLVKRADEALYEAKGSGRNRVVVT